MILLLLIAEQFLLMTISPHFKWELRRGSLLSQSLNKTNTNLALMMLKQSLQNRCPHTAWYGSRKTLLLPNPPPPHSFLAQNNDFCSFSFSYKCNATFTVTMLVISLGYQLNYPCMMEGYHYLWVNSFKQGLTICFVYLCFEIDIHHRYLLTTQL